MFGGIVYGLVGLVPTVAAFWKFMLTLVLFNLTTASVVLWLSIAFADVSVASLVGTLIMLFKCVSLVTGVICQLIDLFQPTFHGTLDQSGKYCASLPVAPNGVLLPRCFRGSRCQRATISTAQRSEGAWFIQSSDLELSLPIFNLVWRRARCSSCFYLIRIRSGCWGGSTSLIKPTCNWCFSLSVILVAEYFLTRNFLWNIHNRKLLDSPLLCEGETVTSTNVCGM